MTQDEIIEMARQAGIGWGEGIDGMPEFLEVFAKLVAAKEREECALLCEEERIEARHYSGSTQSNWLAKKIRNRK